MKSVMSWRDLKVGRVEGERVETDAQIAAWWKKARHATWNPFTQEPLTARNVQIRAGLR